MPYGDVAPDHGFKHVMDVGEYGFGNFANSLELGCDCLGEIRYLDAHYALPDGEAMTKRNVICIHEEDYGILWKHWDHFSGASEVRRSRRLVVSSIHTVGNYEYGIFWYLYLDGSIQLEMKLSGILNTSAIVEGADDPVRPPHRPPARGAAPPAPVLRAPRHGRRRHRQHGRAGRRRGAAARARQPVLERVRGARDAAAPRVGGGGRREHGHRPLLGDPVGLEAQRARRPDRLPAEARPRHDADAGAGGHARVRPRAPSRATTCG